MEPVQYTEYKTETPEKLTELERYLNRKKNLHVSIDFFPAFVVYLISNKEEREKSRDAGRENMEKVNQFWQTYHESGKEAAELFYKENVIKAQLSK